MIARTTSFTEGNLQALRIHKTKVWNQTL
jgi:hypothetical protein